VIIHIVGGGPKHFYPPLGPYDGSSVVWVGVDRGVKRLLDEKITPHVAFGDFDSVTENEWEEINQAVSHIKKFVPEKDETDMELALNWAIRQQPERVRIFGATGGRLDHFMANVQLLTLDSVLRLEGKVELIDDQNIIAVYPPGEYRLPIIHDKKYVSFLPLTPTVKQLSLQGFKYPLHQRDIFMGSTLTISNELKEDYGTFSFTEGILMMIRSNDL
jgi:thiamine pyrophosphokinase